ncbi:hypothetical protein K438DRAFT_1849764 [Mycena galopus ATCC 62051]|nr:hypothetical protein K438DRAFT_1849764 [Mycena galopus ATCC 62051]
MSTALMRALHVILHPDLVCLFWNTMGALYTLAPRCSTSSSMPRRPCNSSTTRPQSACVPRTQRGLENPNPNSIPSRSHGELVAEISAQARVPYRSGVWRGRPAADTVVRAFAQAMLGAPERAHIAPPHACAHSSPPETGLPPPLRNADYHLTPCYMRPPHEGERGALPRAARDARTRCRRTEFDAGKQKCRVGSPGTGGYG